MIKLYGINTAKFDEKFAKNIEELNTLAMKYAQYGESETALGILQFCNDYTKSNTYGSFPYMRNLTLNNLGCLYRRMGKVKHGLSCLQKALVVLSENNLMRMSAMTYLNLCAVMSQQGK